jgi:hypothetical protein
VLDDDELVVTPVAEVVKLDPELVEVEVLLVELAVVEVRVA